MRMVDNLTKDQLEALLDTIPIGISFIDENDLIKYLNKYAVRDGKYNQSLSLIGKRVHGCHTKKYAIDKLNQMLADFKSGKLDTVESWIADEGGEKFYQRWFAVRDKEGKYLGTATAMYFPGEKARLVEKE